MSRPFSFEGVLGWALLLVLLSFYGIIGAYAPYLVLLVAVVAIPVLVVARAGRAMVPDLTARGFIAAFVLLAVAYALAAQNPRDVLIVFNFAWLLLFVPMQSLLGRLAGPKAPAWIARLALGGVALTLAVAVAEHFLYGEARVGHLTSDPVRIANTAVILGFVSLVGLIAERGRWRLVYLAGPVFAVAVAYFAGTRGAMAAAAVIALVATLLLVRRKGLAVLVAAGLVVAAALVLWTAAQLHVPRVDTLVASIQQVLSGTAVADESAQLRLAMQHSALEAFVQRPWFGYGWQRLIAAVTPFMPNHLSPDLMYLVPGQPHLHNDIADFAVAGGILGLVAYALILFTPLVAAVRSPRDSLHRVRVVGTGLLTACYAVLGLNSLMFGYEVHTALYCGLAAVLLGFCRETSTADADAAVPVRSMRVERGWVERGTVWALLALALVLPTLVGLVTPYVVVVLGAGAWLTLLVLGRLPESYRPLMAKLFLIAFVALAVLFALTAKAGGDVLFAFNFTMLLLCGPLLLLLSRAAGWIPASRISWLAALGVVVCFAMVYGLGLAGMKRPAGFDLGPIVLSNGVLALAVMATTGVIVLRSRRSLLLLLAIPLAVAVTVLTQSRGPLIAVLPLLIFTALMLWFTRFRHSWLFWVTSALTALCVAVGAVLLGHGDVMRLPRVLGGFFGREVAADQSSDTRLALYRAGWQAFLDSPWVGHGWARLMSAAKAHLDPSFDYATSKLPQLHNDMLNFAVAGGVVGVGLYLLIVLTPVIAAIRSPGDALKPARLYATGGLAIVYIGGGVTDLMFGHEFHTMLFVMLNAIVLGLVREPGYDALSERRSNPRSL